MAGVDEQGQAQPSHLPMSATDHRPSEDEDIEGSAHVDQPVTKDSFEDVRYVKACSIVVVGC